MKRQRTWRWMPGDGIRQLLLAWLLATAIEYLLLPGALRELSGLEGVKSISGTRVAVVTCGIAAVLFLLSRFRNTAAMERWAMAGTFGVLTVALVLSGASWILAGACMGILGILVVFACFGWDHSREPAPAPIREKKSSIGVAAAITTVFFLLVCGWTLGRLYTFTVWTYDFGLFAQMFHSMKTTGLPMTTLERDGLLSHFAVHVSSIYYLMLPFYMLVPHPATLQVLQAAVMASAVIPLWKIGKQGGLCHWQRVLLCALLLSYPAYAGGASKDLHENCFLTPLLLWLFYGIQRKHTVLTGVFALLTLTVKEDAAVYVAVAGLYLAVKAAVGRHPGRRWELFTGLGLLVTAIGWFLGVTGYLAASGDGVMTYRYENLMAQGDGSLLSVVVTVLLCPAKALWECTQGEKLTFFWLTMLPLLGLPLVTRRYERYLLLIPYVLINFLSDYPYQYDILYQYNFGPAAFLLYLTAINLADLKWKNLRLPILLGAVAVSVACFASNVLPLAAWYPKEAIRNYSQYETIRQTLDVIPEEATVAASTRYTTYLSRRAVLYDVRYCTREHLFEAEYIALDLTSQDDYTSYCAIGPQDGLEMLLRLLKRNGYQVLLTTEETMILHKIS